MAGDMNVALLGTAQDAGEVLDRTGDEYVVQALINALRRIDQLEREVAKLNSAPKFGGIYQG